MFDVGCSMFDWTLGNHSSRPHPLTPSPCHPLTLSHSSMDQPITVLFVYGTLQRGQCRERFWPHPALRVEPAVVRGRLYDLGPYPALVEGDDLVGGEAWHLAPEHIPHTLTVLDEVEDAAVGEAGLYARRIVECRQGNDETVQAYAYHYSRPWEIAHHVRVAPGDDGICRWPPASK
jgi:gamma-glutamylcyclotransferase (GGCT)/AIG2-like uncharacterized protein YtfP